MARPVPVPWRMLVLLGCAGAGVGYWLSQRSTLDEGQVIAHYAAQYVAETGGQQGDCHAIPGRQPEIWLVVLCDGAQGRYSYPVGHDGALVTITKEEA